MKKMTTKTKNNNVSEEFKTKKNDVSWVIEDILGCCTYEDLIVKDNTPNSDFNISSWVKAYNEYGITVRNRAWYDDISKPGYDLKEFNYFGISGTYFEITNTYYSSKLNTRTFIKNNKIKRLLSGCSEKTKQSADVYIVEIDSKIYIYIDKY